MSTGHRERVESRGGVERGREKGVFGGGAGGRGVHWAASETG